MPRYPGSVATAYLGHTELADGERTGFSGKYEAS